MVRYKWLKLTFLLVVFFSCGKKLPDLNGFDKKSWIADKKGCLQDRSAMIPAIKEQQNKLLALDEMKIVALLGKPDEHELSGRNQKFFYYFLEPAKECSGNNHATPLRLVIRFNAVGLAKEVSVE